MGRRRGQSGGDALIVILIAGAIAIAALGVVAVAVAAAAVVGWLGQLVARHTRGRALTRPSLVQAPAAASAPPPEQTFHEVMGIDPAVFGDSLAAQSAAVGVFSRWAAAIPRMPRDARDAVKTIGLRRRRIGRLVTRVEGRRFAWRTSPVAGRARPTPPPVDPGLLDPWNPPGDLAAASLHVATCPPCAGEGRSRCEACGGDARVACRACSGAGKVPGVTASGARRVLDCKSCRGRGGVPCRLCTRGRTKCGTCRGARKLERWLEIDASRREDVQIEPDGQITRAYAWGVDGVSASRAEIERDARVVAELERPRWLTVDELAGAASADWLDAHLEALTPRLGPGEQVSHQSFTLLEVPSIDLTYGAGGAVDTIELHGLRMLAPPVSGERLLHRRAASLHRLSIALACVPIAAAAIYAGRGHHFHSAAALGAVLAAAALAAIAYRAVWSATLGRRTARRWLVAALAPAAAAASLAILAEPSIDRARDHLAAGRALAARAELEALGAPDRPDRARLWNQLRLREALAEPDVDRALALGSRLGARSSERAAAQAHVDRLALSAARAELAAGDLDRARMRLAQLGPIAREAAQARNLAARIELADGAACLSAGNWRGAVAASDRARPDLELEADAVRAEAVARLRAAAGSRLAEAARERDLVARVEAQRHAFAAWAAYRTVEPGTDPPALAALRAANQRDQTALDRAHEAERARREAAEASAAVVQAAAEARAAEVQAVVAARAERRREGRERRGARAGRGLVCRDRTVSPSCSCGGPRRGCCSRHGGVAGCE